MKCPRVTGRGGEKDPGVDKTSFFGGKRLEHMTSLLQSARPSWGGGGEKWWGPDAEKKMSNKGEGKKTRGEKCKLGEYLPFQEELDMRRTDVGESCWTERFEREGHKKQH